MVKSKLTGNIGRLDFDSKEGTLSVAYYDLYTKELIINYYKSLEDLCEEWEDYEDPKGYWYIGNSGLVCKENTNLHSEAREAIGNRFETGEEAEKAVEKLKAWKRLKDKGFRFDGYDVAHNGNGDLCGQIFYNAGNYCIEDVEKDLDLLFGGGE